MIFLFFPQTTIWVANLEQRAKREGYADSH